MNKDDWEAERKRTMKKEKEKREQDKLNGVNVIPFQFFRGIHIDLGVHGKEYVHVATGMRVPIDKAWEIFLSNNPNISVVDCINDKVAKEWKPEEGDHFWALANNQLLIVGWFNHRFEVCGPWECGISTRNIIIVEKITNPLPNLEFYYGV
jgi:hypothetical protein